MPFAGERASTSQKVMLVDLGLTALKRLLQLVFTCRAEKKLAERGVDVSVVRVRNAKPPQDRNSKKANMWCGTYQRVCGMCRVMPSEYR